MNGAPPPEEDLPPSDYIDPNINNNNTVTPVVDTPSYAASEDPPRHTSGVRSSIPSTKPRTTSSARTSTPKVATTMSRQAVQSRELLGYTTCPMGQLSPGMINPIGMGHTGYPLSSFVPGVGPSIDITGYPIVSSTDPMVPSSHLDASALLGVSGYPTMPDPALGSLAVGTVGGLSGLVGVGGLPGYPTSLGGLTDYRGLGFGVNLHPYVHPGTNERAVDNKKKRGKDKRNRTRGSGVQTMVEMQELAKQQLKEEQEKRKKLREERAAQLDALREIKIVQMKQRWVEVRKKNKLRRKMRRQAQRLLEGKDVNESSSGEDEDDDEDDNEDNEDEDDNEEDGDGAGDSGGEDGQGHGDGSQLEEEKSPSKVAQMASRTSTSSASVGEDGGNEGNAGDIKSRSGPTREARRQHSKHESPVPQRQRDEHGRFGAEKTRKR